MNETRTAHAPRNASFGARYNCLECSTPIVKEGRNGAWVHIGTWLERCPAAYPVADQHHSFTYWTGPIGEQGTHVTGHKSRKGATVNYYGVSCTCQAYGVVTEEITGHSIGDVREELDRMARDHAASHVG